MKLIWKVVQRCVQHPSFMYDVWKYATNDLLSAIGYYRYPLNNFVVVGLPKSGSTWLYNMLLMLPGVNLRYYRSLNLKDDQGKFRFENEFDNIDNSFFVNNPKRGYSAYKFHIRYSERNASILNKYAGKWIVLYRDIRDVCVSLYFYLKVAEEDHYHDLYRSMSQEQALNHSISLMKKEFIPWIKGWCDALKQYQGQILEVKYEDLWANPRSELERILVFYGINTSESFYSRAIKTKISKPQDLQSNLDNKSRRMRMRANTARKGGTGGWKEYFSEKQKDEFKKVAGQLLIDLGYEKDFDW